ncbi:tripartite motif-containing protein 2-like [Haliotis rufescens]|uniref:tripartite motif-containing protein 2-like n=1 Tax=Haliotis rufescens TaxID=6454 RepID=UPI00201E981D|nr:tripartite motif-containing protein 2-like [Haliotis rufescens]
MATSQAEKVTEFLTCVICQELYTDPCTLRCDHTFCRKCVTGYIQTRPDAIQSKAIPCAFCRQDTKVPSPSRPVEEWAGQIKPSIIIQGLIDTQADVVKTGSVSCCSVCEKLGETTPGASWCSICKVSLCERCVKMHRANPASHGHEICDLSGKVKVKRRRKIMCREHKDEVVKLVCEDCHKAVCQTCCVIYHRKCESVVTLESILPTMTHNLREKANVLSKNIHRKQTIVQNTNKKISGIEKNKVAAESHIKSVVERVIANIKQKKKQLINKVRDISDKQTMQLKAVVKSEEIEMQMSKQHCEFIDQALVSDCEMDLYDAYQAWESRVVELGDFRDTDTVDKQEIDGIRFMPDIHNIQYILNELQLGKIDVTRQDQSTCLPSPVRVDMIDGRMASDEGKPDLQDITVLFVDGIQTIVVSDMGNNSLKSFYTRKKKPCHSKLPLGELLCCVTRLKENQVLVSVAASREIVTVEVTPDLKLLSTITTSKTYISLAVLGPSSLAAGTDDCVDILDMAGYVLRSVTTHNKDALFAMSYNMCVNNKGNILVSDCEKKSVTCVTPEGGVVWRYAPTGDRALSMPAGITTTSTGDILLADMKAKKMIQLTDSAEYVGDVATSQAAHCVFCAIHVDRHDTLYVCGESQIRKIKFM